MASVDLICLANSYKHSRRCIAGLRVDGGGWVRPVSERQGGELEYVEYRLLEGGEPGMLDVIRVGLSNPQPLPHQPENWRINTRVWELMERPATEGHAAVVADSLSLSPFLFGCSETSVPVAQFQERPATESLVIVQPGDIEWRTNNINKSRASFRLWNIHYDLPLTDPAYVGRVKRLGEGRHSSFELGIPEGRKVLFTISLSEPLDGICYKLVAAVVTVPTSWDPFFRRAVR